MAKAKKTKKKELRYKHKLWLEIERVEIDEEGDEIDDFERGENFGEGPIDIKECESLQDIIALRDKLQAYAAEPQLSQPQKNEDYEILEGNERFLWDHLKALADTLAPTEKWEQFKALVGEKIAFDLLAIIDQGPDPRMPA